MLDSVVTKAYDALRGAEPFRLVAHDLMAYADRLSDPVQKAGALGVIMRLLRHGHPLEKVRTNHARVKSSASGD